MKAYRFILRGLSARYGGIQAGHAMDQCWLNFHDDRKETLLEFARNHRTYIDLDGGTSFDLSGIWQIVAKSPYPYGAFNEPDLGGLLTAVVVVVPEKLYDEYSKFQSLYSEEELKKQGYTEWEIAFMRMKESLPLAR